MITEKFVADFLQVVRRHLCKQWLTCHITSASHHGPRILLNKQINGSQCANDTPKIFINLGSIDNWEDIHIYIYMKLKSTGCDKAILYQWTKTTSQRWQLSDYTNRYTELYGATGSPAYHSIATWVRKDPQPRLVLLYQLWKITKVCHFCTIVWLLIVGLLVKYHSPDCLGLSLLTCQQDLPLFQ